MNERVKFEVHFLLGNRSNFINVFYAYIREVNEDCIIVEEYYVTSDENYNEKMAIQKRRLKHGLFEILNEK